MSEPPPEKRARRRPSLSAALKAAKEAGLSVRSATVEGEKMTLVFVGGDAPVEVGSNEWDEALKRCDKH
jgi:hypothetical protein